MKTITIATLAQLNDASQMIDLSTHDGVFHADEVAAVAIIAMTMDCNLLVARTRDQKVLDRTVFAIVDVGAVCSKEGLPVKLDHHQWNPRKGEGLRENGVALASAGLAWREYGESLLHNMEVPVQYRQQVWERVDAKFIQPIDALDTGTMPRTEGVSPWHFSALISAFNPADGGDFDAAFVEAVQFAAGCLRRAIESEIRAVTAFQAIYLAALDCKEKIMVLDVGTNWQEPIMLANSELANIDFVVFQDPRGQWMVQCVPPAGQWQKQRKTLPEAWAALRNEEFKAASGVEDGIFCHPGRFICGAESKEGALRLAAYALMS